MTSAEGGRECVAVQDTHRFSLLTRAPSARCSPRTRRGPHGLEAAPRPQSLPSPPHHTLGVRAGESERRIEACWAGPLPKRTRCAGLGGGPSRPAPSCLRRGARFAPKPGRTLEPLVCGCCRRRVGRGREWTGYYRMEEAQSEKSLLCYCCHPHPPPIQPAAPFVAPHTPPPPHLTPPYMRGPGDALRSGGRAPSKMVPGRSRQRRVTPPGLSTLPFMCVCACICNTNRPAPHARPANARALQTSWAGHTSCRNLKQVKGQWTARDSRRRHTRKNKTPKTLQADTSWRRAS